MLTSQQHHLSLSCLSRACMSKQASYPWFSRHRSIASQQACTPGKCLQGMLQLHSHKPPILHRDLKSPNLLVDKHWRVKVADFNLSRVMEAQTVVSSISANNPRWLAPEVVTDQAYSTAADVYSFGLILWELLTWQLPWADLGPFQVSSEQAYQGHRSLWKPAGNPIQAFVTQSTSLHWACRHCCISARQHQNAEISLQICGFCKLYLALLALL